MLKQYYVQPVLKQYYVQPVLKQYYVQPVLKQYYVQPVLKQTLLLKQPWILACFYTFLSYFIATRV